MNQLLIQLFAVFGPIAAKVIQRLMERNNGRMPTDEEMYTEFIGNADKYLAEGVAWKAANPKPGT